MHLHYDDDLLEAAVFVCASGRRPGISALAISRFQREREALYRIPDPDDRNAAFFKLHLTWFREWGLEQTLAGWLEEFPWLESALQILAFRKARDRRDEAAELYVKEPAARHGVVSLRPEQFADDAGLAMFLRHELTHLEDMVTPAFGYEPSLSGRGRGTTQQRLACERYRLWWDITIDGRLSRAGHAIQTSRETHQSGLERAYAFWPHERRQEIFEELWNVPQPTHARLAALATDPRDLAHAEGPLPGGACPLCGFPTFSWADTAAMPESFTSRVRAEFPQWTVPQGLCARCAEIYEVALTPPGFLNG